MKRFEQQLEAALRQRGWLHEETVDLPDNWWAARAWRIRSTAIGRELLLTFVGHYQDGNTVSFDSPVGRIVASDIALSDHLATEGLPELAVDGRDYPERVDCFVSSLDDWQSGSAETNTSRNFKDSFD